MHADAALSEKIRVLAYPDSTLKGRANLLVMPNLDTGNITYNMLKMTGSNGVAMGPILRARLARAHPDHQRHRAPHRQHDGAGRGGCAAGSRRGRPRR